jgi:hypothetical protein
VHESRPFALWARLIVALASLLSVSVAHAWGLSDLGGGVLSPPAMSGSHLYIGTGLTVDVYDLGDPTQPVLVDRTRNAPTPAPIRGIAVVADTLYVAWSQGASALGGVSLYSLADPAHPAWIGELDGYPGEALIAFGAYVYLVGGETGTIVLDAHDPRHPMAVGSNHDPIADVIDELAIVGNRLYMVGPNLLFEEGITVFDLSDPTNIVLVGNFLEDGTFIERLTIHDDYAVGVGLNLQVLDLHDPANIVEVFSTALTSRASRALVDGDVLYVFVDGDLQVWDYATPSHPSFIRSASIDASPTDEVALTPAGPLALTGRDVGLLLDDTTPDVPTVKSQVPIPVGVAPSAAAIDGDHAYVAEKAYGFTILDARSLESLGRFEIEPRLAPGNVSDLVEKGGKVFLAGGYGIFIVDSSDPAHPVELGRYALRDVEHIEVEGQRGYASTTVGAGAFAVIDVSDAAHMKKLGLLEGVYAHDIVVRGDAAFLASDGDFNGSGGLRIIDLSDETAPRVAGMYTDCGALSGNAVAVNDDGTLAYLACEDGTLRILDTHDLVNPTLLGLYTLPDPLNFALSLGMRDNRVYLGHLYGIDEIDVQNPAVPVFVSRLPTVGEVSRLAVSANALLALSGEAGVFRFDADVVFRNGFD